MIFKNYFKNCYITAKFNTFTTNNTLFPFLNPLCQVSLNETSYIMSKNERPLFSFLSLSLLFARNAFPTRVQKASEVLWRLCPRRTAVLGDLGGEVVDAECGGNRCPHLPLREGPLGSSLVVDQNGVEVRDPGLERLAPGPLRHRGQVGRWRRLGLGVSGGAAGGDGSSGGGLLRMSAFEQVENPILQLK